MSASRLLELWQSTVGKKALAAVSGALLWLWLVLHLIGNLSAFSGPVVMDGYAQALRRAGPLLWLVRAGLAAAFAVHVATVISLARRARAARPIGHALVRRRASTLAARTMRWGGALLFAFAAFHVLHMSAGVLHPAFVPGRVHANLVRGLRQPAMAALYAAAAALVALHLRHGLFAAPRSLGVAPPVFRDSQNRPLSIAAVIAAAMFVGFAAVPIAVALGVLR